MGRGGWEYVRTDMVPTDVKSWFGTRKREMPFLVFRRAAPSTIPVPVPVKERVQETLAMPAESVARVAPRRVKSDLVMRIRGEDRRVAPRLSSPAAAGLTA
jgi:hypothetical protein